MHLKTPFIIVKITCYTATEDNSRPFSLTIKAESCPISLKECHMVSIFNLLYSFLLFILYLFSSLSLSHLVPIEFHKLDFQERHCAVLTTSV